jgi:serine/threonine protein kinase
MRKALDIWALGVLIVFLITGKPIHISNTMAELKNKHKRFDYFFDRDLRKTLPPELYELIVSLLQPAPEKRPTIAQVWEHPWIKSFSQSQPDQETDSKACLGAVLSLFSYSYVKSKFFVIVSFYITHFLLPQQELDRLCSIYLLFDCNLTGQVTLGDIKRVLGPSDLSIPASKLVVMMKRLGSKYESSHESDLDQKLWIPY